MDGTIFANPLVFASTCAVLVAAQVVYVSFGFGAGLIAVGSLALVFPDVKDAVVLLLLVNLPAELLVAWHARREVRWRPIAGLGIGIAAGIPLGAWILGSRDAAFVLTVLGWFLVAVGVAFLRLPAAGVRRPAAWWTAPTGLASGLLTGMFGTGGPPLIIWYHLRADGKAAFRGNLMTIFLLMTLVRVPSYLWAGLVTGPRLRSSLLVLPAALLGAWLGQRLHIRISEAAFRRAVAVLLAAIGLLLILGR